CGARACTTDGVGRGPRRFPPACRATTGRDPSEAVDLVHAVDGLDQAHGARLRAHHQRLRVDVLGVVAHALQEVTVGDAGGREEAVVAGDEVVGGEHLVEVV